jgi:hypothetical protein
MPGFDKRQVAYTQARSDLLHEMLRGGLFDMDEHDRGENIARIVRDLKAKYPELDDQMTRRLVGEGMQRTYGDATWGEGLRSAREMPERER